MSGSAPQQEPRREAQRVPLQLAPFSLAAFSKKSMGTSVCPLDFTYHGCPGFPPVSPPVSPVPVSPTLYFWKHPLQELQEFRRGLRDGGGLLLGFKPKTPLVEAEFPPKVYTFRTVEEVRWLLAKAGFSEVAATEFRSANRVIVLLTACAGVGGSSVRRF